MEIRLQHNVAPSKTAIWENTFIIRGIIIDQENNRPSVSDISETASRINPVDMTSQCHDRNTEVYH